MFFHHSLYAVLEEQLGGTLTKGQIQDLTRDCEQAVLNSGMNTAQAASFLGVNKRTFRRWVQHGHVTPRKFGPTDRHVYLISDVLKFLSRSPSQKSRKKP